MHRNTLRLHDSQRAPYSPRRKFSGPSRDLFVAWDSLCNPICSGGCWQSRSPRCARIMGVSRFDFSRLCFSLADFGSPVVQQDAEPSRREQRSSERHQDEFMILKLRKRHRRTFIALMILLPSVLLLAISMRRSIPVDGAPQILGKP